jgi:iron complex transport system substrate-binding protein
MALRSLRAALAVAAVVALPACGFKPEPIGSLPSFPQTVVDGLGRKLEIAGAPRRIASLDPGATESLFALGVGPSVVAASGLETYPPGAKKLPVATARPGTLSPALRQARADMIVVPSTWAAPDADRVSQRLDAPVYVAGGRSVVGVEHDIAELGLATGRAARAQTLVAGLRERVDSVRRAVESEPPVRVFVDKGFFFTIDPHGLAADLLRLAGGKNVAPDASLGTPVSPRLLRSSAPQAYLAYSTSSTSLAGLRRSPSTSNLPAVRSGHFAHVPPSLLEDSGPHVGRALARVARLLHPSLPLGR